MSQDAENIKKLVAFKKKLEEKVAALESDLKELQAMLEAVNSLLLEKGFKRAEIKIEPAPMEVSSPSTIERENVIPLKTFNDELLANLYVGENLLRVVPSESKAFNINTPPFTQFLVEKVFFKMQEKDNELVRSRQLSPDKVFSYEVVRDGDIIREIVIRNFDADRLRELKSSIRWTLEKMNEKMKI